MSKEIDELLKAAKEGNLAEVDRLLQIPEVLANAHAYDNLALKYAASRGHLPVMERLLQVPQVLANNDDIFDAFLQASAEGHLPVVERLSRIPAVRENINAVNDHALRSAAANGYGTTVLELCKVYREQNKELPANITIKFLEKELSLVDFINEYERPQKKLLTAMAMSYGKTRLGTPSSSRQFPKAIREHILLLSGLAKPSEKVDQIINQLIEERHAYEELCNKSGTKATAEGRMVAFITSLNAIMHQMGNSNRGNVFRDMTNEDKKNLHQAIRVLMEDMGQVVDEKTITEEYAKETGAAVQTLRRSLDDFQDLHGRLPDVINEIIETLDKGRFFGFSVDTPPKYHF